MHDCHTGCQRNTGRTEIGGLKTTSTLAMVAVGRRGHNVETARTNMLPGRAHRALTGWLLMRKAGTLRLMKELKKALTTEVGNPRAGREQQQVCTENLPCDEPLSVDQI